MKKIVYSFIIVGIIALLNGCVAEKRQYSKIANGGSGNLEVDKAQCEYQAELAPTVPVPNNTDLTINIDNRQGYGSTNYSNVYGSRDEHSLSKIYDDAYKNGASIRRRSDAKKRIQRLTDLCLKSRGWSWKVIK